MADKKISQLTAAATPLAGTEVLPIVQGGSTVKVSAADITAGRAVGAGSLTVNGAAVVNESGGDNDFRVEGDTDVNLLFVDASADKIGVGNNTPATKFDVSGSEAAVSLRVSTNNIGTSASNYSEIQLADVGSIRSYWRNMRDGSGDTIFSYNSALKVLKESTEVMRLGVNGELTTFPAASATAVFNENGVDADFRVEGDGDANALFVDASTDRVSVGTNAPQTKFHVVSGTSTTRARVTSILSGSDFKSGFEVNRDGTTGGALIQSIRDAGAGGVGWEFLTTADNAAEVSATYTSRLTIDRAGDIAINTANKGIVFAGNSNVLWRCGAGSPEGAVTAPVGSLFTRTNGGANTTFYVKESGAGNTGWVAK